MLKSVEISVVPKNRKGEKVDNFEDSIKRICTINSLSELSYIIHHLKPLNHLAVMDINIFKKGIKAMWEDKQNIGGGKYIIRLKKEVGQRIFEKILIHFYAESFKKIQVNGLVLSIRPKHFILGIWTKECPKPKEWKEGIEEIKHYIGVEFYILIEFKKNGESLKDNSSFRNAALYN